MNFCSFFSALCKRGGAFHCLLDRWLRGQRIGCGYLPTDTSFISTILSCIQPAAGNSVDKASLLVVQ